MGVDSSIHQDDPGSFMLMLALILESFFARFWIYLPVLASFCSPCLAELVSLASCLLAPNARRFCFELVKRLSIFLVVCLFIWC